jgi:UDP-N-acetylglucosamine--N-acetylmuramyl-(pentapeptide) pyrophosphoryl-undecaprenol N-acetylglucosamine transferase
VGGSLGAQALNQVVPAALGELARAGHELPQVRHQTGRAQREATHAAYAAQGVQANVQCTEFIDDMAQAYGWADLVICRAGALTVSELAAAGVASWLVPFPHAVDDHQTGNARYLSNRNAAVLMPQSTLCAAGLAKALASVSRGQCEEMAVRARAAAHPEATAQLAQACIDAASR